MDQKDNAALPTATIADRVAEYLDVSTGVCTMVFQNPQQKNFALNFETKLLVVLNKMCGHLLHQWHKARPDKGVYFREAGEATVSAFDDVRGMIAIQFDGDIAHLIPVETALKMVEIINSTVDKMSTEEEKAERNRRKHPTIIQPRSRIIQP